jgi:putative ABC transport system permease protein
LLAPWVTFWFGRAIGGIFGGLHLIHLAAQNLVRSLFRNAVTIAALASAAAMLVSVSVMIFSFRSAVDRWINRRLVADLFITPTQNEIAGFQSFVSSDLIRFLQGLPQIEAFDTYRDYQIDLAGNPVALGVVEGSGRNRPQFVGGADATKIQKWHKPDTVIVSEPLARRFRLREGRELMLPTPAGKKRFTIEGIFYDYTRDSGLLLMQRSTFQKYWHDPRVHSIAVYLRNGIAPQEAVAKIRSGYPNSVAYAIHSNRGLKDAVERIFDQTFAVTYLLRGIAMFVAVIGITLNLTVLVKERQRELAVMRSLGASIGQIVGLILTEALLLGALAVTIGIAAGCVLAFVLTEVINKTFFGWTVPLQIPWEQLGLVPLLLVPIAMLAGLAPAIHGGRIAIVDAVRFE